MNASYSVKELDVAVNALMDLGEAMITCGGEISRAEDTLSRLGKAYGAIRVDVFAINSCIMATVEFPDNLEFTRTRRILASESTDLRRLEDLNQLSRNFSADPRDPGELSAEVKRIIERPSSKLKSFIGSMLAASAFTLFFGGSFIDAAVTIPFAAIVWLLSRFAMPLSPNRVFYNFAASFAVGALVGAVSLISPLIHRNLVTIGIIMLMVPGIALTYSVRNILVGDTISGSTKAIEAVFWTASLAAGFSLALSLI